MGGARLRVALVVLVVLAVGLTVLDRRSTGPVPALRRGAEVVLGPVQRALGGAGRALGDLPRLGGDRAEEERLRRENDDLQTRLLERDGLDAQRAEVARLLQLPGASSYRRVLTQVVGIGAYQPFAETVTVDVGELDGVRVGQTVTSGSGLVGRTVRVGRRTSVVALVSDPTSAVGVRVTTTPRSFGLARGRGRGALEVELVDQGGGAPLRPGDTLVTVGSETFVAGVPVGRVAAVETDPGRLVRTARVEPFADLGALDLLQVVLDGPRTAPRPTVAPR